MHGLFSYLEDNPGRDDPTFHELSHGESFLAMLMSRRFATEGFFVLDEPEAGCPSRACWCWSVCWPSWPATHGRRC